jgi:hypothetical protein
MAKLQHGGKRAGAGRKAIHPEGPTIKIAVTVPSGLMDRLDAVAELKAWNRSEAVTEAVRGLLKRHERRAGESNPSR